MKYIHTRYCGKPLQLGFGLPTYRGVLYQDGYGLYSGQDFQRGYGLAAIFKKTIKPALTTAVNKVKSTAKKVGRAALPRVKRVGETAAQQAKEQALAAAMDFIVNKKDLKDLKTAFKKSARDLKETTLNNAIKEAKDMLLSQSGQGGQSGGSRKRKGANDLVFTPSKKGRKTIFD